jgi:DNA-binding NtrC family response regulator
LDVKFVSRDAKNSSRNCKNGVATDNDSRFAIPAPDYAANAANASPASLRDVERQQILAALEQTGWHRGKTAEILGISSSTLYRRLRDYNLERRAR